MTRPIAATVLGLLIGAAIAAVLVVTLYVALYEPEPKPTTAQHTAAAVSATTATSATVDTTGPVTAAPTQASVAQKEAVRPITSSPAISLRGATDTASGITGSSASVPVTGATAGATATAPPNAAAHRVRVVNTASIPTSAASASSSPTDVPFIGESRWATPLTNVNANSAASASMSTASANPRLAVRTDSATNAVAGGTSTNTDSASPLIAPQDQRCATIAPEFRSGCVAVNGWFDSIGTKYGARVQQHCYWLRGNAAFYYDWIANGCNPLPCAFDTTGAAIGRLQPADYAGQLGYDSPLGTCHSTTPFKRDGAGKCASVNTDLGCSAVGAMSTTSVLPGTLNTDDGKVHGWVRWHSDWYEGVVEDATCEDACVVGFDHPCSIDAEREQPAQRWDVHGVKFYSWYWGGDPINGEPPW